MTDRSELNLPSTVTETNRYDLSEITSESTESIENTRSTSGYEVIESNPNYTAQNIKPREQTPDNSSEDQKLLLLGESEILIPHKSEPQPPEPKEPTKTPRLGLLDPGVVVEGGKRVISGNLIRALRFYSNKVNRLSDGNVKITLNREVPFKTRSAQITGGGQRELDIMAFVLRNYEGFDVHVTCHAGDDETKVTSDLTKRRAQTVARYLIAQGLASAHVRANDTGILDHPVSEPKGGRGVPSKQRIELVLKPAV